MTPPVMLARQHPDMRADRLLSILLHLDTERRVTARELARKLEVSTRTILRDLDALSAAGVPVVAERGANGGWFLLEPYRTDLTGLTADEARSLALPLPGEILAHLGLAREAAVGRAKLNAALPGAVRVQVERMRAYVLVDTPGWQQPPGAAQHLAALQAALWNGRQVEFTYRRMTGEASDRQLDPYGLVFKNGRWYVVGESGDAVRTFRVDRIEALSVLEVDGIRPVDFNLREYWRQSRVDFLNAVPRHPATVLVQERDLPELSFGVRFCKVESQEPATDVGEGWWRVHLVCDTPEVALSYVLGFGARLRVEAPKALRDQVLETAQGVMAMYGKDD